MLWRQKFADTPPVGFRLREAYSEHWIRFHALPKSKRYADTEAETEIILDRANALAKKLFGLESEVWVASSRPQLEPNTISYDPKYYVRTEYKLPKLFSWEDTTESPEDRIKWSTCAKQMPWSLGCFDDIFKKVADDEEYGFIFASPDMLSVLAPYDGGFDLIIFDPVQKRDLIEKYREWLSLRDDGL